MKYSPEQRILLRYAVWRRRCARAWGPDTFLQIGLWEVALLRACAAAESELVLVPLRNRGEHVLERPKRELVAGLVHGAGWTNLSLAVFEPERGEPDVRPFDDLAFARIDAAGRELARNISLAGLRVGPGDRIRPVPRNPEKMPRPPARVWRPNLRPQGLVLPGGIF